MKQLIWGFLLIPLVLNNSPVSAQNRGEDLFNQTCVACHTIGGGRLLGPDLAGIESRRDEAWIISFIRSSQALANSGDADAVAILAEYNGLVMPDQALGDDDIRSIIGYITSKSPDAGALTPIVEEVAAPADLALESIQLGQNLFVGKERFENGAASCISCHSVDAGSVMSGGSLAINLTDAVTRLSRNGVIAMMSSPPFPVMKAAFDRKPLTEDERTAIADFLQANAESESEVVNYGTKLLTFGFFGFSVLMVLFFFVGLRGSKKSVNQAVYDRQMSST